MQCDVTWAHLLTANHTKREYDNHDIGSKSTEEDTSCEDNASTHHSNPTRELVADGTGYWTWGQKSRLAYARSPSTNSSYYSVYSYYFLYFLDGLYRKFI